MPIALENGFHVSHDLAHVSCLAIDSHRLAACVAALESRQMKGILGNPRYGFVGSDFDFMKGLPWIEVVWFYDVNIKNIDGLYSLRGLQHFGVHPKRPSIDFSRFPELRKVVIEPRPGDHGLRTLTQVQVRHVWRHRPMSKDFSQFEFPASLAELQINWANVTSLESLPELPALRRLEVHRCRDLEVLGNLCAKFPRLEHLVVAACGRVRRGEGERVVRDLPGLTHAYVGDSKIV